MSAATVNLDKLKLREDLFKEVKYFVTGNLDAKVKRHREFSISLMSNDLEQRKPKCLSIKLDPTHKYTRSKNVFFI